MSPARLRRWREYSTAATCRLFTDQLDAQARHARQELTIYGASSGR